MPLLDPMQTSASSTTSSAAKGEKPRAVAADSKGEPLRASSSSSSSHRAVRTGSTLTINSGFGVPPAALEHHETLQSLMNSTRDLQSASSDQERDVPNSREREAPPKTDESKRATGRTIRSIRSGVPVSSQTTAQRFEAARKAILAEEHVGPTDKDRNLLTYYQAHHVKLHRNIVAAEFAALDAIENESLVMPLAQLRLLEFRPDLLTPDVFAKVYARLLDGLETGSSLTAALERLSALNRAYPSDSKMLGAMRAASHDSGLMSAEGSATWVRQLFSEHPGLVTADLLHEEFTALRAERMSEPAWMDDAVELFEFFPDKVASIDRAILSTRIRSEPTFSDAEKLALHKRIEAASAAFESPVK